MGDVRCEMRDLQDRDKSDVHVNGSLVMRVVWVMRAPLYIRVVKSEVGLIVHGIILQRL